MPILPENPLPAATSAQTADLPPIVPDHTLLRCIGRGSYGEVWMARNVLGESRAVKIIYRRAFEHERPYEREFDGIRRFEPISRTHPSQLSVLHVGRNDPAGYFYYVMELGDDAWREEVGGGKTESGPLSISARQGSHPEAYVPHTLKWDLDRDRRLPVEVCLKVGLALTTALEHLHVHGLVHRDVKPSNIIFVHGIPKLADPGLIASLDATMSAVGTSGFLPPEGPGTPQADLYSLGKVLYEMSMGRDRQEFPKLPPDLDTFEDPSRLLELNAVLLKACHHDPSQRYPSAHQMAADLLLLQRGHSVRRLRLVERRLALITKTGLAATVLLSIAATLSWHTARQARATARQLYVADMNLALQAWEGGNVSRARELLELHRQRQPDMLGFEWRFLVYLCQKSDARLTLRGHAGIVWSVAISPDGGLVATGGSDQSIRIWDSATGRLVNTLTGHQRYVHAVGFSPEGRWLVSGSRDNTVKIWDIQSHGAVRTLAGHTDAVRAVAFAPDGQQLVSGGEDRTLRWWDLKRLQESDCHDAGIKVEQLAFSPDGHFLAVCGSDNKVHLCDASHRRKARELDLHQAIVLTVAYAHDGRVLATGSYDGTVRLWDTGQQREVCALGRGAPVYGVAFAPGDRILAAATEDGLVRLWDLHTREVLVTLRGHCANVRALAFSLKGGLLASSDELGLVKLWEIAAEPGRENALPHTALVNALAFSPDGQTLASTDPNPATLRLWQRDSRQVLAAVPVAQNAVWSAAFAPDGKSVVTGGIDGTIRFWTSTDLKATAVVQGHEGGIDSIVFSPDGRFIVTGSRDHTAKAWRAADGQLVVTLPSSGGPIKAVAVSPDAHILATGCNDGQIHLWSANTFQKITTLARHLGEIRALAFSPSGKFLVSGGADRIVRVWDLRKFKLVQTLAGHTAMISSLGFTPDGRTLASGSWDSTVRLWNLQVFREVATLKGHAGQVTHVAFAPDANTLASSSSDGTVRLWQAVTGIEPGLSSTDALHR